MPEHVTGTIDTGPLAVPDPNDTVALGAGRQIDLLRAPDGGRRQVFVHTRLEDDIVGGEVFLRRHQLLVVAAEGRPAIAGNEARGVKAVCPIPPDLCHRQPNERLDTCEEDTSGALSVFLIETDRALVDSHVCL
jgi:hypothetical protein